ncbi:hypothetical protein F5B21DRAFT_516062 [Xylaria acuta]|nr:hypothetical protein F5B21DRAFT_516062 [Xylaria acuta]
MPNPYYTPSYDPYPSSVLIGTGILFIIVPIAAVSLRFYAQLSGIARLGIDDWLALPAVAIVQIIAATAGGLGGHQQLDEHGLPSHTPQLYVYEKTRYAYEMIGAAGLCLIKLSVLLFFRRIFSVRAFINVNNVVIGLTVGWGIAYIFALMFQCVPPSTLWNKLESEYGDHCVMNLPSYLSFAFTDPIPDVIIFLLPVPHLWQLNLPMGQKLGVASIFFLGSLNADSNLKRIIEIGTTRTIIYTWVMDFASKRLLLGLGDLTWYSPGVLFWHLAENGVGVLCACMPSFAPLFKGKFGRDRSKNTGTADTTGSSHRHRMAPPLSPYYERIEDQTLLHRSGSSINGNPGSEEHALYPVSQGKRTSSEPPGRC